MIFRLARLWAVAPFLFSFFCLISCGEKPENLSIPYDAGNGSDTDADGDGDVEPCSFECVAESACTPEAGTKIDANRMVCADPGKVCCALLTACDHECVAQGSCETGGGLVHSEQICAGVDQICCETPCVHECMTLTQCDEADGRTDPDMSCETPGNVCCEPGAGYCQNPYTCVLPKDCESADERDGKCVDGNQVCCLVARCSQNDGICRSPICLPLLLERAAPAFYCSGGRTCCK